MTALSASLSSAAVDEKASENPTPSSLPLVEIRGLYKHYQRGPQRVPVLQHLDLVIFEGDFVALMGPSGSGKSTLLNLIAGLDQPTAGQILIQGEDITKLSESVLADWRASSVGFIFQFYNLIPVLTALDNVILPLTLTNLNRAEQKIRAERVLKMVGLGDRMDHYPNELSGGQQQRVAVARAIVTDPMLIVADEPTGDLDHQAAAEILEMLQALNRQLGKTIIMVTHDPEAVAFAKRSIHLSKGVLLDSAAP